MQDCFLKGNFALANGGSIFARNALSIILNNTKLKNNSALKKGDEIYVDKLYESKSLLINSSSFNSSNGKQLIYAKEVNLIINSSTFSSSNLEV